MSNPFALFRKNQTAWMAGLVLLALLAFVVAPAIQQITDSSRGGVGSNAVVVRWDGGSLTAGDVDSMTQRNSNVRRFLTKLGETVIESGGQPQVPGFRINPQNSQIDSLGINPSINGRQVCQDLFMLDYAKRLGIAVDEEAVNDFIRLFCDKRINDDKLLEILQETTNGRLSVFELRDTIRKQLISTIAGQVAMSGIYAQPPGKTYRDFKKINQTAKVEVFPVVVADFVSKVSGEPSEAEIQAIYDAGSLRASEPSSPEPGFVRLYKADFEYLSADVEAWQDREKAKLTEDDIRAEYDRRVELGQLMTPVNDSAASPESTELEADTAAEIDTTPEIGSEESAPETTPEGEAAPAENTEATATQEPAKEDGDDQSRASDSRVRFVSYQDESTEEEAAQETTEPAPAETPAADPAQDETAIPSDDLPPTVVQPPQLGQEASGDPAAAAQPEMRVKTFEEAREEIADSLAQQAAAPAMQAAIETLLSEHMQPYFQEYRQYVALRDAEDLPEAERNQEAPVKPNIKQLAEAAGLSYSTTSMVDAQTLIQGPFGQSMVSEAGAGGNAVAQTAMSTQLTLFRPMRSTYFNQAAFAEGRIDFRQYLFWKTEEKQAYIPELDEVRDEVVDAWKVQQARRLAADAAEAVSAKVGSGDNAWSGAIEATEQALLIQTQPFSWYTQSAEGLRPTDVRDLDMPGTGFMQTVFSAAPGKTVVAANQPQSVYYVTRVLEYGPEESALLDLFSADPRKSGAISIANSEVQQVMIDWYSNLEQDLDVQWLMPL